MQLTRERITEAALRILAEYGLGDVSMRRVAAALGVAPGALYWHIKNKQELIASMAEVIVSPLMQGPAPGPEELSAGLRAAALGIRDGAEVLVAAVSQPDARVHEALSERFVESVGRWPGLGAGEASISNGHAAALGLMHLTLGGAAVHQASAQLAEATGGAPTDEAGARKAHAAAVRFLLAGYAQASSAGDVAGMR